MAVLLRPCARNCLASAAMSCRSLILEAVSEVGGAPTLRTVVPCVTASENNAVPLLAYCETKLDSKLLLPALRAA